MSAMPARRGRGGRPAHHTEFRGLPRRDACCPRAAARLAGQRHWPAGLEDSAAIAYGDLFLADIRAYREARHAGTGVGLRFPLWGMPTQELAHTMLAGGLRATITCVDPQPLDASFAGREYDAALLRDLPAAVDCCGENGEFHTFVHAGPMFSSALAVAPGAIVERDGFVFADLLPT